jgi:tetratricopeptide (TPR) repeat protein
MQLINREMKRTVYLIIISAIVFGSCNQSGKQASKFYDRGNSEVKAGNLINSIVYYNKAIALDSTQVDIYMARGNARLTTVDYDGATKDFTKVIQLDPGRAEAYFLRAMIEIYKKEFTDDAVADLNKAIQLDPGLAKAYYNLGVIKFVRNDLDGACIDWKKAAEMGYEQAVIYINKHCKQN